MLIYAPNKHATGTWCSTKFVNGVGETNDPHLIAWFLDHGYRVEDNKKVVEPQVYLVKEDENDQINNENDQITVDLEAMTPNELREWLKANGHGSKIKNIRDKEKLLNIARG